MDRIVISFPKDSPDDDFKTICRVICPKNIIETELFMLVLKRAAKDFFKEIAVGSDKLLQVAVKLVKSRRAKQSLDGLHLLSKIIYRTPTDTTVFLDALLARSLHMMRMQKYPLARNDLLYYKTFPPKLMTPEGLVLVQTLLCSSLYYTREICDARGELHQLEEGLEVLSDQLIKENHELNTFLRHLEKYKTEIKAPSSNVQFKIRPKSVTYVPLHGFSLDKKIPSASALCEYVTEPDCVGVYARRDIPKGSVVIAEAAHHFQFSAPFMNCEVCAVYQDNLYTCSKCRCKSYCSLACLKSDWEEHQHECYGYQIGIIQMLEAKLLFRFFVQAAKCVSPALASFTLEKGPIRNAIVAWNFIVENSKSYNTHSKLIGEFLCRQPNCKLFTTAKWRQLVTIALRLAVFVHNDTKIPETYFDLLKLTKNDSIILYTTLFLRLNTHIVLNSQQNELEYQYGLSADDELQDHQTQLMTRMNMNAFAYYSINAHTDFVSCYNKLEQRIAPIRDWKIYEGLFAKTKRLPTNVGSPMFEYISKLLSVCISKKEIKIYRDLFNDDDSLSPLEIEQHFENLNTSDRCEILKAFANYFHQFIYDYFRNEKRQEKTAVCATLKSFTHACNANIEIRSLKSGPYLGVAKVDLSAGTELTVSQGSVSHLNMSRAERRAYFQAIGITCKCAGCTSQPLKEPTNIRQGIYCAYCLAEVEITPIRGNCRQCNADYNELKQQYTKFISCALDEIHFRESNHKTTQRDITVLYGMYHSYVTMHFVEAHELRLSGVIIFIEYLITKGFINHACDVIFVLLSTDYSANTLLTKKDIDKRIFNLLRRVMQCYIDNFLSCDILAVDGSYPKMLLSIIQQKLKAQERDFQIAIEDREAYNTFLANYTEYYKWKKIINANLTMSMPLQSYLNEI